METGQYRVFLTIEVQRDTYVRDGLRVEVEGLVDGRSSADAIKQTADLAPAAVRERLGEG